MRVMKAVVASRVGPPLLTLTALVAVVEGVYRLALFHELIWPSPLAIVDQFTTQFVSAHVWHNLSVTVREAMAGFVIGSASGFLIGLGMHVSRHVRLALKPYVLLIQSTPRIIFAPVIIAVLGFGMSSRIVAAVVVCFFPVLINTAIGLTQADEDALDLMRSWDTSTFQILYRLQLPSALPAIFAGLKTAMTLAFIGAVVAEFAGGQLGLGRSIKVAAGQLRMPAVYAYLVWLGCASLIAVKCLDWLDRRVTYWRAPSMSLLERGGHDER